MPLAIDDLRVLQQAEAIADAAWKAVSGWDGFARDAMGKQLIQAADSIGANIAEAYGRFHYGEKLTFFYYARGSLFETKYWLNRAVARGLIDDAALRGYTAALADLARQLNALVKTTREQRATPPPTPKGLREPEAFDSYSWATAVELFGSSDLSWLES